MVENLRECLSPNSHGNASMCIMCSIVLKFFVFFVFFFFFGGGGGGGGKANKIISKLDKLLPINFAPSPPPPPPPHTHIIMNCL